MQLPTHTITFEAALRDATDSRTPRQRAAAADALGDVTAADQRRQAVEVLIRALSDPHPDVQASAALALGDLGDWKAVPALAAQLDCETALPRQTAAMALGKLGSQEAFAALASALRDGPPDLRFQAVTSLVEVDADSSYDLLVAALTDPDGEVVGAVALGLAAIGDGRAVGHLSRILAHERPHTRFEAAYALAQLESDRGLETLCGFVDDSQLGWSAVEALEQLGSQTALPALTATLERPRGSRLNKLRAAAAVLALAPEHSAADTARATILQGLRSLRFEVRSLAVQTCARVGGSWATVPLTTLRNGFLGRALRDEIDTALQRCAG